MPIDPRDVKDRISLTGLVSEYVKLNRVGAGLCPFHKEKTPSFRVNEEKRYFKCFGCDAAGDVFDFVMAMEGITFPEAVKRVAERCGITIEAGRHKGIPGFSREMADQAQLYRIALIWRIEKLLPSCEDLLDLDAVDGLPITAARCVRELTMHLEAAKAWSGRQAVALYNAHRNENQEFVDELVAEAVELQILIATAVTPAEVAA